MSAWLELAQRELDAGHACALISVTRTYGSTPREAGACMLITRAAAEGTIGGGKLELDASERARALLARSGPCELAEVQTYNLGAGLGQCCGGRVEVLIQRLDLGARDLVRELLALRAQGARYVCVTSLAAGRVERAVVTQGGAQACDIRVWREAQRLLALQPAAAAPYWLELPDRRVLFEPAAEDGLSLLLFGAGHVGRALVHVVAPLAWPITWVETRDDAFPPELPAGVRAYATDVPESFIDDAGAGGAIMIMTHDHALDFRLCERTLRRGDAVFCGLIGSRTKRAKFEHRLAARGWSAAAIARITCPIGLSQLSGKKPFEVAISAAAQLLQVHALTTASA